MCPDDKFREIGILELIKLYFIVICAATVIIILIVSNSDGTVRESTINTMSMTMEIIMLTLLMLRFKVNRDNFRILLNDCRAKIKIKEILSIFLFRILISVGICGIAINLIYNFMPNLINSIFNEPIYKAYTIREYFINFISLAVLSPILDELCFRRIVFRDLLKKFNIYTSLVVSTLIFTSLNIGIGMIGALVISVANTIIYVKYRNILVPIMINFFNSIFTSIILLILNNNNINIVSVKPSLLILNLFIGMILSIFGIILFVSFIMKNKHYLSEYAGSI